MLYELSTSLGCFFLFSSFILNLFIVIGQVSNKPFINRLYFAQASQKSTGQYYNLGLWNYCTATAQDGVQSCAHPKAGYNWMETPGINNYLSTTHTINGLFLGVFILFIIGLCFAFLLWVASLPLCCVRSRGVGGSMSVFIFITFLVMLAALIIELVLVIRGARIIHDVDSSWSAQAGNSLWLTIASVVSLLLAFFSYGGSCCCVGGSKRDRSRVDPDNEKNHVDYGAEGGNRGLYNVNQSVFYTGQPQQQYQTPNMQLQQPYQTDTGYHSPMQYQQQIGGDNSPRLVGDDGRQPSYQTPVLQHSDADGHVV
ncbi:SUR7/PalI family-domain-containing protein [Chlamydoabsidia padenii]|nr:SUR7/PalI family-domain-containing protein [Chlamydoabsidia padenii]